MVCFEGAGLTRVVDRTLGRGDEETRVLVVGRDTVTPGALDGVVVLVTRVDVPVRGVVVRVTRLGLDVLTLRNCAVRSDLPIAVRMSLRPRTLPDANRARPSVFSSVMMRAEADLGLLPPDVDGPRMERRGK